MEVNMEYVLVSDLAIVLQNRKDIIVICIGQYAVHGTVPEGCCSQQHRELWRSSWRGGGFPRDTRQGPHPSCRSGLHKAVSYLYLSSDGYNNLTLRDDQGVTLRQRTDVEESVAGR